MWSRWLSSPTPATPTLNPTLIRPPARVAKPLTGRRSRTMLGEVVGRRVALSRTDRADMATRQCADSILPRLVRPRPCAGSALSGTVVDLQRR